MSEFGDAHIKLCSRELMAARGDSRRMAEMVASLTDLLCLTIAVAVKGDPRGANTLVEGIGAQLHEGVAEKAPMAAFIAGGAR